MKNVYKLIVALALFVAIISSIPSFCMKRKQEVPDLGQKKKKRKLENNVEEFISEPPQLQEKISEEEVEKCGICLGKMRFKNKLVKTKCDHTFHKICLERNSKYHQDCPICKTQLHENEVERQEPETILVPVPVPVRVVIRINRNTPQEQEHEQNQEQQNTGPITRSRTRQAQQEAQREDEAAEMIGRILQILLLGPPDDLGDLDETPENQAPAPDAPQNQQNQNPDTNQEQ